MALRRPRGPLSIHAGKASLHSLISWLGRASLSRQVRQGRFLLAIQDTDAEGAERTGGMGTRKTWGSDGGPEVGLVTNHWHCTDGQRWELVGNQVFLKPLRRLLWPNDFVRDCPRASEQGLRRKVGTFSMMPVASLYLPRAAVDRPQNSARSLGGQLQSYRPEVAPRAGGGLDGERDLAG